MLQCSVDTVVAAEWHPLERNTIVTCGKNHISFWSLDQGGALYKRMGVFSGRDKPKYVTCLAFTQSGDVLSGDSNGSIILWARGTNTVARVFPHLHDGPIFSICVLKDGSIVSGGGKDGMIRQFDSDFQPSGYETQVKFVLNILKGPQHDLVLLPPYWRSFYCCDQQNKQIFTIFVAGLLASCRLSRLVGLNY